MARIIMMKVKARMIAKVRNQLITINESRPPVYGKSLRDIYEVLALRSIGTGDRHLIAAKKFEGIHPVGACVSCGVKKENRFIRSEDGRHLEP